MTATTAINVHHFTRAAGSTTCVDCGKSRNTKAHGYTGKRSAARTGAEAAAAKEQAVVSKGQQVTDTAQAAEDAVTAVYEKFAATRRHPTAGNLAADLAEATAVVAEQVTAVEEAPADARSARATELADAVAAGQVSFDAAATELLGGAPAVRVLPRTDVEDRVEASMARKGPAPEVVAKAVARFQAELDATAPALGKVMSEPLPGEAAPVEEAPAKLFSVWVGWRIADMLMPLPDGTPLASVGAKLRAAKQGRRLARTVRLTPAEREALAAFTTQVENDATAARGRDAAALIDSARTLRARLTA